MPATAPRRMKMVWQDWVPTRGTPTGDVFRVGAARCGCPGGDFCTAGPIFRTEGHAGGGTPKDENGLSGAACWPSSSPRPPPSPNEHAGTGIWFLYVDCSVGEGGGENVTGAALEKAMFWCAF